MAKTKRYNSGPSAEDLKKQWGGDTGTPKQTTRSTRDIKSQWDGTAEKDRQTEQVRLKRQKAELDSFSGPQYQGAAQRAAYYQNELGYNAKYGDRASYDASYAAYQDALRQANSAYRAEDTLRQSRAYMQDMLRGANPFRALTATRTAREDAEIQAGRAGWYGQMAQDAASMGSQELFNRAQSGLEQTDRNYGAAYERYLRTSEEGQRAQAEQIKSSNRGEYFGATLSREQIEGQLRQLERRKAQAEQELSTAWDAWRVGSQNGEEEAYNAKEKALQDIEDEIATYNSALGYRKSYDYSDIRRKYTNESGKLAVGQLANRDRGRQMYEADREAALKQGGMNAELGDDLSSGRAAHIRYRDSIRDAGYFDTFEDAKHLNEEDRDIFYALYAEDPEKAREWLSIAKTERDEQYQAYLSRLVDLRAGEHLGTAGKLADIGAVGAGFVLGTGSNIAAGVTNLIDPYSETALELSRAGQAFLGGGSRMLNREFGTFDEKVPFIGNILGGKGLGDLYTLASSVVQSHLTAGVAAHAGDLSSAVQALGVILMGSGAAASDYDESLKRGLTEKQARQHAFAAGLNEAAFEWISLDKLVNPDFGASAIKQWLTQSGIEASEEFCTTIANRLTDGMLARRNGYDTQIEQRMKELIALGVDHDAAQQQAEHEWTTELINDALGGFLSGGAGQMVNVAANYGMSKFGNVASEIQQLGRNAGRYQEQGAAVSTGEMDAIRAYAKEHGITVQEAKAPASEAQTEGQTEQQAKPGKREQRRRSQRDLNAGIAREETVRSIYNEAKDRSGAELQSFYKETVDKYGEGIQSAAKEAVTRAAAEQMKGIGTLAELDQAKDRLSAGITDRAVLQAINDAANMRTLGLVQEHGNMEAGERIIQQHAGGKHKGGALSMDVTVSRDGAETQASISGISQDGKSVQLSDGSTLSAKEFESASMDADTKDIVGYLLKSDMGPVANLALRSYEQEQRNGSVTDGYRFVMDYAMAYDQGRQGAIDARTATGRSSLSAETVRQVYDLGRQKAVDDTAAQQAEVDKRLQNAKNGVSGRKGSVDMSAIQGRGLSDAERKNLDIVTRIAEVLGVDVKIFVSGTNAKGQFVGENGRYKDGKIEIDIHAGRNSIQDIGSGILATMSHELTHFIQEYAPTAYAELKQFALREMTRAKGTTWLEMQIQSKIDRSKGGLSKSEAEDELVADACQNILTDSKAVHDYAKRFPTSFAEVLQWIKGWFAKVREALSSRPMSAEAKVMSQLEAEVRKAFGELWDKGVTEAAEVHSKVGSMRGHAQAQNSERSAETYTDKETEKEHYGAESAADGVRFSLRTEQPPTKTQSVYKLMRLGKDGNLYPLFIDSASGIEVGKWYDADSPDFRFLQKMPEGVFLVDTDTQEYTTLEDYQREIGDTRKRKLPTKDWVDEATKTGKRWMTIEPSDKSVKRYGGETRRYYNVGINGSGSVSTFALRPGWHAGSLPTMRQIGKGANKNLRDDTFVWVQGRVPADIDYQAEAERNVDKDIPTKIPKNGYYLKATNANATASQADRVGWYVAGSFIADRIMGDAETREVIDRWNAAHPNDEPVEYDYDRESGKVFNAETMQLEERRYSERDTEYLELAKDPEKNQEKLQEMVAEAAKEAGYNSPKLYHGTNRFGFTVVDSKKANDRISFFTTDSPETAGTYSGTTEARRISVANGSSNGMYQLYANTDGFMELDAGGAESNHIALGRAESDYNYQMGTKGWRTHVTAKQAASYAKSKGFPGVVIHNVIDTATPESRQTAAPANVYVFFNPQQQVKSADPVTYDDDGNVIPLSERFNTENQDIRYSEREDQGLRDRVSELEDQLEMAEVNGLSQAEIQKLNNELIKARGQLDSYTANQRRQAKKTSYTEMLTNMDSYDRMDLESLAEQISDGAWDGYEDLSDEDLIDALRETINERLEDFEPGDADNPKYGLWVKKPKTGGNISTVRYSERSTLESAGLTAELDENGRIVARNADGKIVTHVNVADIDRSGIGALINYAATSNDFHRPTISKADARIQKAAAADLVNMILKTNDAELVWRFAGSALFSAVKSNSDGQYGTTIDFSTVCRKTQEMVTAMSEAMMKLKRGLTKDEVIQLQKKILEENGTVPCPVCYVFSRWAGVGGILDNMHKFQQKYGHEYDDPKVLQARIRELEEATKTKANLRAALRQYDTIYMELAEKVENLQAENKSLNKQKPRGNKAKTPEGIAQIAEINRQVKANLAAIDQAKRDMKRLEDEGAPELAWLKRVRSAEDYWEHGNVPAEVLFNLDDAASFADKYSVSWGYRTTRGPSAGKAILPYSDMQLGDLIMGPGRNRRADVEGSTFGKVENGVFSKDQNKAIERAIARTRAQNLIGGQRYQSTSDFRYDYGLDYIQSFWEAQALGSNMQTYTKIVEFAELVATVGGDVNLSVMPLNSGVDKNGYLVYSSVTGINAEAAIKISNMYDSAQLILVGINDEHIRTALDDFSGKGGENVGFVIPYHASGASINRFIRGLVENLKETFNEDYYKDYSPIQTDSAKKVKGAKAEQVEEWMEALRENPTSPAYPGKKPTAAQQVQLEQMLRAELREAILKHKIGSSKEAATALVERSLDLIRGTSKDISGMSFEELRAVEERALHGDAAAIREYTSWSGGVLWDLYNKMWVDESNEKTYGVELNTAQAHAVMPHEYWNKKVDRAHAYVNGFIFRSYCYNLGLIPRFTGVDSSGKNIGYGDFSDSTGYWKTLIDRSMYDNQGRYRDQQTINATRITKKMLTPEYGEQRWGEYKVREPQDVTAKRAAERFVDEVQGKYSMRDYDNTLSDYDLIMGSDGDGLVGDQKTQLKETKERISRVQALRNKLADTRAELKSAEKKIADLEKPGSGKLAQQMRAAKAEAQLGIERAQGKDRLNRAVRAERDKLNETRRALRVTENKLAKQIQREQDILSGKLKLPAIQKMLTAARDAQYEKDQKRKEEQFAGYKDRKNQTAIRNRIKNLHAEMERDLLRPREGHFVPEALIRPVVELLDMVDVTQDQKMQARLARLDAQIQKAETQEQRQALEDQKEGLLARIGKLGEKIDAINVQYDKLKSDERYSQYYDETVKALLVELSSTLNGRSIYDLNSDELSDVYTAMKAMRTTIRNAIRADLIEKGKEIFEVGNELRQELRNGKGAHAYLLEKYHMSMLNAQRAFNRFGGYRQDSTWNKVYRMLDNAQLDMLRIEMEATRIFDPVLKAKADFEKAQNLTSLEKGALVDVGLRDENGRSVWITRGMMLSLYMHLQNEQNMKHLMYGGLTLPDFKRYYNGNPEAWGRGTVEIPALGARVSNLDQLLEEQGEAWVRSQYKAMEEDIKKMFESVRESIEKQMTDYDRKWIEASKDFFDNFSRRELNRVTNSMYGFSKAKVDNYFPIVTDSNFLKSEFDSISRNVSLENVGFMKERVKASNPILLEDITRTVNRQISNVSRYAGLTEALKQFGNIYNVQTKGFTDSVKKAMAKSYGKTGQEYIQNLITDMVGGRSTPGTIFDRIKGNYAQAVLSANLSVTIKQAASYPTAAAVVGWKPLMKALAKGGKNGRLISRADRALIDAYSPLLWKRSQGAIDTEIGDMAHAQDWTKKAKWLMGWIEKTDIATVGRLWYAAEYYVQDNFNGLEKGTAEQIRNGESPYYQKVAEIFNRIVEETQPNYTVLQRPDILRNPNKLVRSLVMFSTQRFQNGQILMDAAAEYFAMRSLDRKGSTEETKAARQEAKRKLTWAITSQAVSAVVLNAMTLLAGALMHRMNPWRDDDDEITLESTAGALLDGWVESLAGSFLGGSEIYEALDSLLTGSTYYGNDVGGLSSINDFASAIITMGQKAIKLVGDDNSKPEDWANLAKNQLWKVGEYLSQMTGVPVANVRKIIEGGAQHVQDAMETHLFSFEAGLSRSNTANARRYADAWETGDRAKMQAVIDEMNRNLEKAGKSTDGARDAITKAAKERYEAGEIELDQYADFLRQAGYLEEDKIESKIRDFLRDELVSGDRTEEEVLRLLTELGGLTEEKAWKKVMEWKAKAETGDGEEEDEAAKYSEYDALREDLRSGTSFQDAAADYLAHGYTEKQVRDAAKNDLKARFQAGELSEGEAIDLLVEYSGKDENACWKTVQGWQGAMEHPDEEDYSWGQYDAIDEALAGNKDIKALISELTAHGVKEENITDHVKEQIVKNYVDGKTSETALKNQLSRYCKIVGETADELVRNANVKKATGYSWDDLDNAYRDGNVSATAAKQALTKYGKLSTADANARIRYWDFKKAYPDSTMQQETVDKYYNSSTLQSSGLTLDNYVQYYTKASKATGTDKNGDGRTDSGSLKAAKMQIINGLNITRAQKDALYYFNGWSAKTIWEAPWH